LNIFTNIDNRSQVSRITVWYKIL